MKNLILFILLSLSFKAFSQMSQIHTLNQDDLFLRIQKKHIGNYSDPRYVKILLCDCDKCLHITSKTNSLNDFEIEEMRQKLTKNKVWLIGVAAMTTAIGVRVPLGTAAVESRLASITSKIGAKITKSGFLRNLTKKSLGYFSTHYTTVINLIAARTGVAGGIFFDDILMDEEISEADIAKGIEDLSLFEQMKAEMDIDLLFTGSKVLKDFEKRYWTFRNRGGEYMDFSIAEIHNDTKLDLKTYSELLESLFIFYRSK